MAERFFRPAGLFWTRPQKSSDGNLSSFEDILRRFKEHFFAADAGAAAKEARKLKLKADQLEK